MFASKTPRDLNHDPMPWRHPALFHRHAEPGFGAVYSPRPEFDHVQHNEPNPFLVEARQAADPIAFLTEALTPLSRAFQPRDWSDWHAHHASRVLTRLARFAEVAS